MLQAALQCRFALMCSPAQLVGLQLQRKRKHVMQLLKVALVDVMAVQRCGKKEKGADPGGSSLLLLELISVQVGTCVSEPGACIVILGCLVCNDKLLVPGARLHI